MKQYSVIIPAFNAAYTLNELIDKIRGLDSPPEEILVVNDGSTDQTSQKARNERISVIDISTNQGKGWALKTGFEHYLGQKHKGFVICMNADLQHPPEYIPQFINYAHSTGCHFVIGNRSKKPGEMPLHRIMSNRITSFIISKITGQSIFDSQCGFRLIDIDIVKNLDLVEKGFQLESEMILKAAEQGVEIGFVPIPVIYHNTGSHIGNFRDTVKFVRMVLKYLLGRHKVMNRHRVNSSPGRG